MNRDQQIYQQMLKAIVEHQLAPGLRLPEDKLAETFSISRTGVRKVLQRLALEKFVTIEKNKGAHVNQPSVSEACQVLDSRIMIEPLLIEAVIENWNCRHQTFLERHVQDEAQAHAHGDLARQIELTAKFHIELAKISDNSVMADFVRQLAFRSSLVVAVYGSQNSVGCHCGCHQELIALIERKQLEASQNWMRKHLQRIKESLNFQGNHPADVDFAQIFTPLN